MDDRELTSLYDKHYTVMLGLAKSLLGDDEESRDVVEEVFAAIVHNDTTILPTTERPYLLRCVRNRCVNIINRMTTRQRVSKLVTLDMLNDAKDEDGENAERLRLFMSQWLSKRAMTILYMRFADGMKYREIAETLHISEAAVYKSLTQSLMTIRQHFKVK